MGNLTLSRWFADLEEVHGKADSMPSNYYTCPKPGPDSPPFLKLDEKSFTAILQYLDPVRLPLVSFSSIYLRLKLLSIY